jgi:hypothetical protein
MLTVKAHMADIDLLLLQGMAHKTTKRIVADAPDKPAVAAKASNAYRHVSRCAAGTL